MILEKPCIKVLERLGSAWKRDRARFISIQKSHLNIIRLLLKKLVEGEKERIYIHKILLFRQTVQKNWECGACCMGVGENM